MATWVDDLQSSDPVNQTTINARLEQISDTFDGMGDGTIAMAAPSITSFANSAHDHEDAAGGGLLDPLAALDFSAWSDGEVLGAISGAAAQILLRAFDAGDMKFTARGGSPDVGWLLCDGSAVSRTTYADLFGVISTTFGVGDGSTTFNLPDMRGMVPAGMDNMGTGAANNVTDAQADILGGSMGAEDHTLDISEIPAHDHDNANTMLQKTSGIRTVSSGSDWSEITNNTSSAGGGGAHNNMQPTLFGYWWIKT